ncbi:PorP/SprF family type IX secretion system membrane protein [Larkinella arboricola]|uniref:Type IX secretion system PorP/SprF family membrane protein n=1 Tax=Larkinella arboricola TaxID=643671 RepID=A0A327WV61_LARAB|nr:type IX secretion system membrane protein PorP/SprF [Larkinella arboricola]RAJ95586.1 type IX secretion system PorP/SprF family membrane protein [Larkinella arboricola]
MNRKLYAVLLLVVGMGLASTAEAQNQDPQFSMFMFNPVYYNPAAVGSEGVTRFQLVHRTQYMAYQGTYDEGGSPSTQLFSFNMPLSKIRSGIGLYAVNEVFGPQGFQKVQVAYAFRVPLKKGTLSLGAEGGLHNWSINYDRFRPNDPEDPLIQNGRVNQTRPDIGAGIYYNTDTYYVGASMKHLNQPDYNIGTDIGQNPLYRTAYITAGYRYEWNYALDFMPSAVYKFNTDGTFSSLEVSLLAMYDKRYWAGLGYRQGDAFSATAGISLLRNNSLRFGYAFDFVVSNRDAKSPTSHEILLSYSLPEPRSGRKPIIRTPRFRY